METINRVRSGNLIAELVSDEIRRDPYPTFESWRTDGDIYDAGFGLWFALRHRDCTALLRRPETRINDKDNVPYRAVVAEGYDVPEFFDLPLLIRLDPPDHTRIRGLVNQAFTARRLEMLRPRVETLVDGILDELAERGECDISSALAFRLPITVIAEMLAIPEEDRASLSAWSHWMARSLDPRPLRSAEVDHEINAAMAKILDYARTLVAERRRRPGDDLVSDLVAAHDHGDRLTEDELLGMILLLFVAGHETIAGMIGNGVVTLAAHPEALAELRGADPAAVRVAVDELLRFDAPTQFVQRTATADLDLGGVTIPDGHMVVLMLGAANRDPEVFPDPDRLVLTRRPNPHLSFGKGMHHCLGAALSRLEGEVVFAGLARRFREIEVHERVLRPTYVLRGYEKLTVTLTS